MVRDKLWLRRINRIINNNFRHAIHEAGHAVVIEEIGISPTDVLILPTGGDVGGLTIFSPQHQLSKEESGRIDVAGEIAEAIYFGQPCPTRTAEFNDYGEGYLPAEDEPVAIAWVWGYLSQPEVWERVCEWADRLMQEGFPEGRQTGKIYAIWQRNAPIHQMHYTKQ